MKRFLLTVPLFFNLSLESLSQVASNMKIDYDESSVVITYDLSENAAVYLEVYEGEKKFTQYSATGDVGFFISSGNSKKIIFKPIDEIFVCFNCIFRLVVSPPEAIETIGTQMWMTKNLNVSTFRNGDPIPEAKSDEEWKRAAENKQPAWCYFNNDPANGEKYGKLYNWYAVNDQRGLAPVGYHIPSYAEWTRLVDYLGSGAGTKMKSKSGWEKNGNGTNSSGFSGLPGGGRFSDGTFYDVGKGGYWWSFSETNTYAAWDRELSYGNDSLDRYYYSKGGGFSVRCLRD